MNPQEESILLIELYRDHSFLWDPKDKAHHNRLKREEAWEEISAILKHPVSSLKSRIKTLMGTYRSERSREKKTRITKSGCENVYESKWFAYKYFDFLKHKDNHNAKLNTERSEVPSTNEEWHQNADEFETKWTFPHASDQWGTTESQAVATEIISVTPPIATTSTATSQDSTFRTPTTKKDRKRKKVLGQSESDEMMGQALEILQSSASDSNDLYFTYALNLANELRKYDAQTLAHVKKAIANTLFEADMGRMTTSYDMKYGSCTKRKSHNVRCSASGCTASVRTLGPNYRITEMNNTHNHEPLSRIQLETQVLSASAKRKAVEHLSERPSKVLRSLITEINVETLKTNDLRNIKKNMYNARRKSQPVLPTTREDVHKARSSQCPTTISGENFVQANDVEKGTGGKQEEQLPITIKIESFAEECSNESSSFQTEDQSEDARESRLCPEPANIKMEPEFLIESSTSTSRTSLEPTQLSASPDLSQISDGDEDPLSITKPKSKNLEQAPVVPTSVRSENNVDRDPIDDFFQAMATSVKALPPLLQLQVKQKVTQAVFEAESMMLSMK